MSIPEALLGFALVVGLLTIIPGLDTALVLRTALTRSRGRAYATAAGIQAGTVVWGIAAAVGATALLAASTLAFEFVKLAGAAQEPAAGLRVPAGPRCLWTSTHNACVDVQKALCFSLSHILRPYK